VGDKTADHLAALFFEPSRGDSRGVYTLGRYDLYLHGGTDLADRLVHLHEAHHVLLTATTAWGAALLVASAMPDWSRLTTELLNHCRSTHESFATYLSCRSVGAGFGPIDAALASYPDYAPLVQRLDRYLATVRGEHRRALAATALARVCMQTPILNQMLATWPTGLEFAAMRGIDQPDVRLNLLLRSPHGLDAAVASAADDAVAAEYGTSALEVDRADDDVALDSRFDTAWARWEQTFFDGLAAQLVERGATVIAGNEHLPAAAELVHRASQVVAGLRITVDPNPSPPDQRVFNSVLRQARVWLYSSRRPARLITIGDDVELDEAVRVAEATTRVAGRPNLVLTARLPARLQAAYDLPDDDRARLEKLVGPVVAVRTIADDGTDTGRDAVWLVRLATPADVTTLARAWAGHGDLTCCIAASCLAQASWRDRWLPTLREAAPIIWLIDVDVTALADEFGTGRTVHGLYLDLTLTTTGARRAVAFKADGLTGVWVAVGDAVGVELITRQVADLPGIDLRMDAGDWTQALPPLRLALLDLLHNDSYLDLQALSRRRS
jgi:hypothetical protein